MLLQCFVRHLETGELVFCGEVTGLVLSGLDGCGFICCLLSDEDLRLVVIGLDVLPIKESRYDSGEEGKAENGVFGHLGVSFSLPGCAGALKYCVLSSPSL